MKILIAPLNWGLGHASRCIPLIQQWLKEGHEVVLGGDGDSLLLLRKHFPQLRFCSFAPLQLRYSKSKSQVWAIARSIPRIFVWAIKDYILLRALLQTERFDRIVSDNRFGFYSKQVESIYITHQLHIRLPRGWQWAEQIATNIHARVYARYNKVWVPDRESVENCLAGELSYLSSEEIKHHHLEGKIEYIGPLSRFANQRSYAKPAQVYHTICLLSGLEPQRSLLEQELIARYHDYSEKVMIIRGVIGRPHMRVTHRQITIVPTLNDNELAQMLQHATHIIARSGYSTIMDFEALGVLQKAELIPTPGQPEQEYLAQKHKI